MLASKQETLDMALKALREKLSLPEEKVVCKEGNGCEAIDAVVQIMGVDFLCKTKNSVTTNSVWNIVKELEELKPHECKPVLLVGAYISPNIVSLLATSGINTLDCVGNCHIRYAQGDKVVSLMNKGEKNKRMEEKTYSAFQYAGLKVIFYLLQDDGNVNKPYREIQKATGISLGAIKNIVENLVETKYILLSNKGRTLRNKSSLFRYWTTNYIYRLKPKLLLARMTFRTEELRRKWKTMALPEQMCWGGEGGAHIMDSYFEPATFDIYTDVPAAHLLKSGWVRQDAQGEISIYQKFWKWDADSQIAPAVLIYADLIAKENGRCNEMANRLLDNELKDFK